MRTISNLLQIVVVAFLVAAKAHGNLFRVVPAERRTQAIPEWPFSFIFFSFEDDEWCLTKKGVNVGLEKCDFLGTRGNLRDRQLFMLDNERKIRTQSNDCMYVKTMPDGQVNPGHSRLKFTDCNAREPYITFVHNREMDELVADGGPDNPSFCMKNTGPRPQRTDSIRAFDCDAVLGEPGTVYEYQEFECVTGVGDVQCCERSDCGTTREGVDEDCCIDYQCKTADENGDCLPEAPSCGANDVECCVFDANCPDGFKCISQMCLSDPLFISVELDGKTWCASRPPTNYGDFVPVDSVECDLQQNEPFDQPLRWSWDPNGRLHSEVELRECMIVIPRSDGSVGGVLAPCKANQFVGVSGTGFVLAQDEKQDRCLASTAVEGTRNDRETTAIVCGANEDFGFA